MPDSVQRKILIRFSDGDLCDSLHVVDSLEIIDLRGDKSVLQQDNAEAVQSIENLQLKAIKQRKWPWIAGVVGFVGGFFIKSQIK